MNPGDALPTSRSPSPGSEVESLGPTPAADLGKSSLRRRATDDDLPTRHAVVNFDAPEETLRDVPLPRGLMRRLRRFIDRL